MATHLKLLTFFVFINLKTPPSGSELGLLIGQGVMGTGTDNGAGGMLLLLFPSSVDIDAASEITAVLCTLLLLYETNIFGV